MPFIHRELIAVLVFASARLIGQDIDTSSFGRGNGFSLQDRAETEAERRAFEALQHASGPAERREKAEAFLSSFPRSWLLASVYQMAAAASFELKDYGRSVIYGRRSLQIVPENAPLLLTLASIENARGARQQARADARDALLWLSVIAPAKGIREDRWSAIRAEIENDASSILGAKPQRPVSSRRVLHFAGSAACAECHRKVYDAWRKTGMGTMLKPRQESTVLADFSVVHEIRDEKGSVVARTGGGNRPWFEFAVREGNWKRFPVDYTIGSKWQQAYVTRAADDRLFVFPVQYSAVRKEWLNYWSMIDPPGTERTQIDRFPGLTPATNYQRNCGVCHTSQLRLMRLDDTTMQRASFREPGVNCEMCHGPLAEHIAAVRSGQPRPGNVEDPPFRFRQLDHIEGTLICGQCHRQSAVRQLGSGGEMNYSTSAPYFVRAAGRPPIEFGPRAAYKDGRYRETTFIGEAFMRSACFRNGMAQCASCHDPHSADAGDNKVSVKFRSEPNEMCLQCHAAIRERVSGHTKHSVASTGSRCTACHMPPIMNSLLFKAASHQIEIPRGDTTLVFGPNDSPNACLLCHGEQSPEWAAAKLQQWR